MRALVVGVELVAAVARVDLALGRVGVGRGERGADALEADAVVEQGRGIELDPHGRQGRAADIDVADARQLRQLLLHHGGGGIVDLAAGQGLRGHAEDDDRRVGGVELPVGRVLPERGRQVGAGRVDGGLDVAGRAVDVAVQAEQQHDPGRAEGVRGRHLVDVRDGAEPPFERRRHRGGHGVGRGAGHLRLDEDDREVDLRQRRHRQLQEGEQPGEQHADGEQRGRHRPPDERLGDVHGSASPPARSGPRRPEIRRSSRSNAR
ncbi:hypothetical protein ABIC24_006438 [Methylobacterium radiotolerans]